jgi:SAM-dependent methyltransferase
MTQQEFDVHAKTYQQVLDDSVSFSGEDSAYFSEYKIRDLHAELLKQRVAERVGLRVLDFGCGVGASIPYVRQYFPRAELFGADVSGESLDVARSKHGDLATFLRAGEGDLPAELEALDAAYAMCVFHHIDENMHVDLLSRIRLRLKPGGLLMVYEHNPLNPLTVRVVNSCPFDANANLICASAMAERCRRAGFRDVQIKYRVFFPGFLRPLRWLERLLTRLPFGGQYYVRCLA